MIQSRFRVKEILSCFYQRRKPNYQFLPSSHSYFEFTYVDYGKLYTLVDEKEYILHSSQCMVYYPNQKHTQYTNASSGCSYLTILFEFTSGLAGGSSLRELVAAYNPMTGNLWLLVLVTTLLSPAAVRKITTDKQDKR